MVHQLPSQAIRYAKSSLYSLGQLIEQENWQSVKSPDNTIELLNHTVSFPIPISEPEMIEEVRPNMPWALDHFNERVGGIPLNPPPSSKDWPFNPKPYKPEHLVGGQFSHTYPERFWPRYANADNTDGPYQGIRFPAGDLDDVIVLLKTDPTTRQAYLPIWFPEDTGVVHGKRVPCTLGYDFIIRNKRLHVNYYMRSCDIIRHLRDDVYFTCALVFYMIRELDMPIKPGQFTMLIKSLHCFANEKELLKSDRT